MSDETENETRALTVSAEMVERAIAHVAEGRSLTSLAIELGVKRQTLYAAIKREDRLEEYTEARQEGADAIVEQIIEIADTEPDAQKAKNRIDSRKWIASKHRPAVYGEKLDLNLNQTVDLRSAMAEAQARVQRFKADVIDAEVVERKTDETEEAPKLPARTKRDVFS